MDYYNTNPFFVIEEDIKQIDNIDNHENIEYSEFGSLLLREKKTQTGSMYNMIFSISLMNSIMRPTKIDPKTFVCFYSEMYPNTILTLG